MRTLCTGLWERLSEGGTLSLLALAQRSLGGKLPWVLALGLIGAALFYGDAAITPAISMPLGWIVLLSTCSSMSRTFRKTRR